MSDALKPVLYQCCLVANTTFCFLLFWTINLILLLQRSMLQAVDIHLALKLIAVHVSFLVMMRGEPSLLSIVRAPSCHGCDVGLFGSHFPIYLPRYRDGCRPTTAAWWGSPVCGSEHLSRCALAPPIFTRPRRSIVSARCFHKATVSWDSRGGGGGRGEDLCSRGDLPPKTTFLNQKSNYKLLTRRKTGY